MNHDLLVPSLGQSLGMVASISEVQAGMVWSLIGAWLMATINNDPVYVGVSATYGAVIGTWTYVTMQMLREFLATNENAQRVLQSANTIIS